MSNKYKYSIDAKEISVVVQGPVGDEITTQCLLSLRKYLPGAEIILSTWEGSDTKGLDCDVLVLNKDPGGHLVDWPHPIMNNSNRQLVSVQGGLNKAKRKYALKIRTDLVLLNDNLLKYYDRFPAMGDEYKLFEHRVLVCSVYSCTNPGPRKFPMPFHPADFYFFGLTKDLKAYFLNTPLMTKEEISDYKDKFLYPNRLPFPGRGSKYSPEQHFCLNWVKRTFKDVKYEDYSDWNEENFKLSNNILYNNFVFLSPSQSGIFSKKYHLDMQIEDKFDEGIISYMKFQEIYKKNYDSNYEIEFDYLSQEDRIRNQMRNILELSNIISQNPQFQNFLKL